MKITLSFGSICIRQVGMTSNAYCTFFRLAEGVFLPIQITVPLEANGVQEFGIRAGEGTRKIRQPSTLERAPVADYANNPDLFACLFRVWRLESSPHAW